MKPEKYVFEQPVGFLEIFSAVKAAIYSRIRRVFLQVNSESQRANVRSFYEKQRFKESEEDIVDGSFNYYLNYVEHVIYEILQSPRFKQILDLGCGQAKLVKLLDRHSHINKYIGIDLKISEKTKHDLADTRVELRESCILQVPYEGFDLRSTLAIFINSLCYINFDEEIKSIFQELATNRTRCVTIVEPHRGLYWENYFDGISIDLRSPNEFVNAMSLYNYELIKYTKMYRFRILGIFIWPIAYSLSFSKRAGLGDGLVNNEL